MKANELIEKIRSIDNFPSIEELEKLKGLEFEWPNELDPNDRTLTFEVKNKTVAKQTVILFGSVKDPLNKLNNEYVEITVMESSHESVKAELLSSIFYTNAIRYRASSESQLDNPIRLCSGTCTGAISSCAIVPSDPKYKKDKGENYKAIVYFTDKVYRIDKHFYLEFDINPLAEVTFTISFFAKVELTTTQVYLKDQSFLCKQ